MKTNLTIALIAGVVVLGGVSAWSVTRNAGPIDNADGGYATDTGSVATDDMDTLRALFLSGKSLTCDFTKTDGHGTQSGTVYIDGRGERLRGDFTISESEAGTFDVSVIRDTEYAYTWGGPFGDRQGMRMRINEEDGDGTDSGDDEWLAYDDQVDFSCSAWRVDETMFTPPSDVEFDDLSDRMDAMQLQLDGMNADRCAACNQVPAGTNRDACLQALGC